MKRKERMAWYIERICKLLKRLPVTQAKYMALYYRLEFMSTEGELFMRKWRQFELFRKKAEEY